MQSDIIEHLLLELCLPTSLALTSKMYFCVVYQLDIASVHISPMPPCVGVVPSVEDCFGCLLLPWECGETLLMHQISVNICVLTAAFSCWCYCAAVMGHKNYAVKMLLSSDMMKVHNFKYWINILSPTSSFWTHNEGCPTATHNISCLPHYRYMYKIL